MIRQSQFTIETLTDDELAEFIGVAQAEDGSNHRRDGSYPLFTSASLLLLDRPNDRIPVIMREISAGGFGLLHAKPIETGQVGAIALGLFESHIKTAELIWCNHAAADLYLSGWHFVHVD